MGKSIAEYKDLIHALPVREQCFTTKRSTWEKAEIQYEWLKTTNERLFGIQNELTISRHDIFETKETEDKILKILYWGYPRGMRGNHFIDIMKEFGIVVDMLKKHKGKSIKITELSDFLKVFNNITGLGLSTYTKFLYFFEIKIVDYQCLILDKRLKEVFSDEKFEEFYSIANINDYNSEDRYPEYLKKMKEVSDAINVKPENLEQFLFIFGNGLKPLN